MGGGFLLALLRPGQRHDGRHFSRTGYENSLARG